MSKSYGLGKGDTMRKHMLIPFIMITGLGLMPGPVLAEIFETLPVETVLLPQDGLSGSRLAVRFDVSEFPMSPEVLVSEAYIQWTAGNLSGSLAKFWAQAVTSSWTEGQSSMVQLGDVLDVWEISPEDEARTEGLVHLKIDGAFINWIENPDNNFGIVVGTENLTSAALSGLGQEGHLVVRYSLVKPQVAVDTTGTSNDTAP